MTWRGGGARRRVAARMPAMLVVVAAVLTVGYALEHRGASLNDVVLTGESRQLVASPEMDGFVQELLTSGYIARRLSARGTIPATPAAIDRAVTVRVQPPRFRIHVAAEGAGYAETVARSWVAAVNAAHREAVVDPARRREILAEVGMPAAEVALERERRRFVEGALTAEVPELVTLAQPTGIGDRIPGLGSLLAWLAAACGVAVLVLLVPGRRPRLQGAGA